MEPSPNANALLVQYRLATDAGAAMNLAEALLIEQTIETPLAVAARYPFVQAHMLGTLVGLAPDAAGSHVATLALPPHLAATDPAQLLNVLLGNASLHPAVTLTGFTLPPALQARYAGPRFGISGLRARTGVARRALTCSALKPAGLSVPELAALCSTLAEAGLDLIKDDHYLADHPFSPFEARVTACLAAVEEAAARTGHRATYVPNLSGTPDQVRRQAAFAQAAGAQAVMIAPFLLGLPTMYELVRQHLDVPLLVHPAFAGTPRATPEVVYSQLLPLFGADAVIFANYGGRFPYPKDQCLRLAAQLRHPDAPHRPAFPVPAGGMSVERVPKLIEAFGPDTILLVGGSLLAAGDALPHRAHAFVEAVRAASDRHAAA